MINKKLELVNEIDLYISPTINGIGVTITPENEEASFSEYLWKDVVEGLIDAHTVTILKDKDIRLTVESKEFLTKIANSLSLQADIIKNKISKMKAIT
tara:strand:- start:3191 stop:3484 length:294 start_codon:yes stop_codon:yes gene_type:complete